MAEKNNSFLKLKEQIKSGNLQNLYLFFGEETFIKDTYLGIMEKQIPDDGFADFNKIFLDGKNADADKIDDAFDAFPMMAEKKLVIIKDSGIFKLKQDGGSSADKDFWQRRLSSLSDFAIVIFDEKEVDKRSALYKLLSKNGLAVEFQYMNDYELIAWIVREVQKNGKKINKSSAEHLLSLCDPGISNVKNELDKLFNYCGDEIYASDIDKVVSKPISVVIFEITDAIMNKNGEAALRILMKLKDSKSSAFGILYLLSSGFDKILKTKLLLDGGATYDIVASKLKVAPFIARKYADNAKKFTRDFLVDRIIKTAEYDMKIKQGELDDWTALMQYIFECIKGN